MTQLHCKVGDLAITVRAEIPENLGRIVHIIKPVGIESWSPYGEVHVWWVESLPGSSNLLQYIYADGTAAEQRQGPIPDLLLRPIVPPKNFTAVTDWIEQNCAMPPDIAMGAMMACDYQASRAGSKKKST